MKKFIAMLILGLFTLGSVGCSGDKDKDKKDAKKDEKKDEKKDK